MEENVCESSALYKFLADVNDDCVISIVYQSQQTLHQAWQRCVVVREWEEDVALLHGALGDMHHCRTSAMRFFDLFFIVLKPVVEKLLGLSSRRRNQLARYGSDR